MVAEKVQRKKRNFNEERETELAAIWGSERQGDTRFPKRRGSSNQMKKLENLASASAPMDVDDILSDTGSNQGDDPSGASASKKKATKAAPKKTKKALAQFKLHCFIEAGTTVNDVREVFEDYEPKVELRTSQKGNLLNKVHYAVLTFKNKAMALHAVKTLDGTNQRDLLGVTSLKLAMMLSREQNKIVRKKSRKDLVKKLRDQKQKDHEDEETFVKKFLASHGVQA
mmetsp:Transcript_40849/g.47506  ORF Transcript_40849/g.47506 Transcript_40849/m.47506 type:complete len:227 (-) Transcript_40849:140-820(-)